MGSQGFQLLFFDTFSHEIVEELNLDLVQFPNPVIVEEVRVIPLGAKVQANFPGGLRLGATNPAQFDLEFFVNDLTKSGASSFERLGTLQYHHDGRIHMEVGKKIPTDGLVLRGFYNAITLAVYGTLSKYSAEQLALQSASRHQAEVHIAATNSVENSSPNGKPIPVVSDGSVGRNDVAVKPNEPVPTIPPLAPMHVSPTPLAAPAKNDAKATLSKGTASPEKERLSSNQRSDRQHKDREKEHDEKTSRSGSRGQDWRDWKQTDSPDQWLDDRHRRSRDRSRSPLHNQASVKRPSRSPSQPRSSQRSATPPKPSKVRSPPKQTGRSVSPDENHRSSRTKSRSPTENNLHRQGGSKSPTIDVLDDVSDISDGDIPDVEVIEEKNKMEITEGLKQETEVDQSFNIETKNPSRTEDIEEISDEEAEWSDEGDPMYPMDFDVDFGLDWEYPVKEFDAFNVDIRGPVYFHRHSSSLTPDHLLQSSLKRLSILQEQPPSNEWIDVIDELIPVVGRLALDEDSQHLVVMAALRGIDLQASLLQPQASSIVRHLKSGLYFTLAVMEGQCSAAESLLAHKLQSTILELFNEPHMAVTLKLLMVRILDQSVNTYIGMERFLSFSEECGASPYVLTTKKLANGNMPWRLKCALSALLTKINLYEVLQNLATLVKNVSEENANEDGQLQKRLSSAIGCLDQILNFYQRGYYLLAQPLSILPIGFHLELKESLFCDFKKGYFSLWDICQTLNTLQVILTNFANTDLSDSAVKVLDKLIQDEAGLQFLVSNHEETSCLIKTLLSSTHHLSFGQYMVCCLQTFVCVDQLNALCQNKTRREVERLDVLEWIQTLHSITLFNQGKIAVVNTLTKGNFLSVIIQLIQHSQMSDETDLKRDMKGSAIRAYASELILTVIRLSEDVDYLKKFGRTLLSIGSQDEASRLYELTSWLSPISDETIYTPEGFHLLNEIVVKNSEKLSPMSQELVTTVRLLNMVCDEPKQFKVEEDMNEHLHKENRISFYSLNLVDEYLQILNRICSGHEQPMMHVITFFGFSGFMLMSTIKPMVHTIKNVLETIIKTQRSEFKDLSPATVLLKVYLLSQVVGPSSLAYCLSNEIRDDILSILSLYTLSSVCHDMMAEVIKMALEAPHTFQTGLEILSRLLPPPIPLQTQMALEETEAGHIETVRNMWSLHIFSIESKVDGLIQTLCSTAISSLQMSLLRVCTQIADLSAATASSVIKAVLSTLKSRSVEGSILEAAGPERVIEFLQALLEQAPSKCAFLSVISDPKYHADVPQLLCNLLNQNTSSQNFQESIAGCIQAILDPEISLQPYQDPPLDQQLANSLPQKDHFATLVSGILNFLSSKTPGAASAIVLRTLAITADYEHGQVMIKTILKKRPTTVPDFCFKLSSEFSKDNPDHFNCVSSLEVFLQTCLNESGFNKGDLCELFIASDKNVNPFEQLADKLNLNVEDAELFQNTEETLLTFAKYSTDGPATTSGKSSDEEVRLPDPEPLLLQFQQRQVYVQCDGPGELWTTTFTMPTRQDDKEAESNAQTVCIDLTEVVESVLPPTFNVCSEIQKVCNEKVAEKRKKKHKQSLLEAKALQNKNLISTFKAGGTVPSLSGTSRGFQRSGQRSRPPNTSRPPSLHVDDFLVLQSRGQQPTGPTGYNKQALKAAQELFAQREAKKGAVGFREATKEPVFSMGGNRGLASNETRASGRLPLPSLGPPKMSFRGSHRPRGGFVRERVGGRDWIPSPRTDYRSSNSNSDVHFQSSRPRSGVSHKDSRKIRDERPRHSRP